MGVFIALLVVNFAVDNFTLCTLDGAVVAALAGVEPPGITMACQPGALSFDVVPAVDTVTGIPVENAHTLILAAELVNFAVRLEQARAERQAEQREYGRGSGLHV